MAELVLNFSALHRKYGLVDGSEVVVGGSVTALLDVLIGLRPTTNLLPADSAGVCVEPTIVFVFDGFVCIDRLGANQAGNQLLLPISDSLLD